MFEAKKKNKTIIFITNLYKPNVKGGAEIIVENLVKYFSRIFEKVVVITLCKNSVQVKKEGNICIIYYNPKNIYNYLDNDKYNFFIRFIWRILDTFNIYSFFKIRKILKTFKPEIVWTHNLVGLGLLIPLAIKSLQIRHIHTIHDVQLIEPSGLILTDQNNYEQNWYTKIYMHITRRLFSFVDIVIFPSKFLQSFYLQFKFFKHSKTFVCFNPIFVKPIDYQKTFLKNKFRKKIFVFIGQLEEHKGVDILLKVFSQNFPNSFLYIIGKGSLYNKLKSNYENDFIKFLGHLPNYKVLQILERAFFVIVPSICLENLPTVILEAFSKATPVIASKVGGIKEIVHKNKTGFLCDFKNVDNELKYYIKKAHNLNLNIYRKMCKNCLDFSKELSIENYFKRIFDCIDF